MVSDYRASGLVPGDERISVISFTV